MPNVFWPCVYSYLHRQQSDIFIPSHKCQPMGRMSLGDMDRAVGLFKARPSLKQIRNLPSTWIWICFDRVQSVHTKMSILFIIALLGRDFSTKYCALTCHKMSCIVNTALLTSPKTFLNIERYFMSGCHRETAILRSQNVR